MPLTWLGVEWTTYDWSYTQHLYQLLLPWPMVSLSATPTWLADSPLLGESGGEHTMLAGGGGIYLGLVPIALALWGGRRAGWPLLLAGGCLLLAAGSVPWAWSGGPFLFINHILGAMGMPLSQPLRFVPLAACGVAVAAGIGAARLPRPLLPVVLAALVLEGLTLGGPAMTIPALSNRETRCMTALEGGAVHPLPPPSNLDVIPQSWSRIPVPQSTRLQGLLLQLHHQLPATHPGIGGWVVLPGDEAFLEDLDQLDKDLHEGLPPLREVVVRLQAAGLQWLLVEDGQELDWMPRPVQHCGGWQAYTIDSLRQPSG